MKQQSSQKWKSQQRMGSARRTTSQSVRDTEGGEARSGETLVDGSSMTSRFEHTVECVKR
jgi:hypothetical protein